MKEFDYEQAINGIPICDSWGRKCEIIESGNSLKVLIHCSNHGDFYDNYTKDGKYIPPEGLINHGNNLFLDVGEENMGWRVHIPESAYS